MRKNIPDVLQANELYDLGNEGIEDKHLVYFKETSWK